MNNLQEAFRKVDWVLLAQQKLTLLQVMQLHAGDNLVNNLSGILHLLDAIQDAAKEDGFPVVFLTEENKG